jgi:hypothetical protein
MSARILPVLVASGLAVSGLALPGRALAANGDCCSISVAGLGDVLTAGAASDLTVAIVKQTNGCSPLRRTVAVRLAGLTAAQLRIDRVVGGQPVPLPVAVADADTVWAPDVLVDPKQVCAAGSVSIDYRLTFSADAPTGQAAVAVAAYAPSGKVIDRVVTLRAVVSAKTGPGDAAGAGGSAPISPVGQPPRQESPALPPASSGVAPPGALPPAYNQAPGTSGEPQPAPSSSLGMVVADPPAGSGGTQVGAGLSARSIAARLSLTALGLMLLGSVGWRLRRRLTAVPSTEGTVPARGSL